MSVVERPLLEKEVLRVLRSAFGGGRSRLALLRLAVVESLLPKGTVHQGPPSCSMFQKNHKVTLEEYSILLLIHARSAGSRV